VYHAILLDPNTASVCSPREIRSMVDEMFDTQKKWLPQFKCDLNGKLLTKMLFHVVNQ